MCPKLMFSVLGKRRATAVMTNAFKAVFVIYRSIPIIASSQPYNSILLNLCRLKKSLRIQATIL